MTPAEYTRAWEDYCGRAGVVRDRSRRINDRLDERARILGCKFGFSGLYCYHNAHNWQDAPWMTSQQHAVARRILDLQSRMWRVNRIAEEYSRALWDASDANPLKRYRDGFRLAGNVRANYAALGVSA